MKCPRCDHSKTFVVKTTRPDDTPVESLKQRRRICKMCDRAFMTYEIHEADFNRLCDLIKLQGPTRRPLITQTPPTQKKPANS